MASGVFFVGGFLVGFICALIGILMAYKAACDMHRINIPKDVG